MALLSAAREGASRLAGLSRNGVLSRRLFGRAEPLRPDPRAAQAKGSDRVPLIGLRGVRKRYKIGPVETEVLRGVDLAVHPGDLLSIMGASGSGKSTLMNIMGLLDRPTGGSCTIAGREVAAMDDDELSDIRNRRIGFVFQSFRLLPRLTALENAALPLAYCGIEEREAGKRAQAMLERVGMAERAEHRPDQLSGGQQQRVAIARALVGSPDLVLADEPTGSLDPDIGRDIMDLFVRLNAEEGIAVAIITHDRSVAHVCTRNARLVDGVIAESPVPSGGMDRRGS